VKRTRLVLAATALAATGLLGACTSQPSAKAVAKDMVQSITLPNGSLLPESQQACMLAVIDKMSSDQVKKLGNDNRGATFTAEGGGDEAMQAFIEELQACPSDGSPAPTDSTSTSDSTATTAPG
jgi:hypothetical protein